MNSIDLTEVVERARSGDPLAFEILVVRTENLVRKLAYPIVGKNHLDDALQESYLQAFRNLSQLREPAAFIPWLSRTVLHVCYRLSSKQKETLPLKEHGAVSRDPTTSVDAKVSLQQALQMLTQPDREILLLREMAGLSYEELAYALRIAEGTVKSRLNTARQRLREALKPG